MRARTKGVVLTKTDESSRINDAANGLKNVIETGRINDVTKGLTPSYSNRELSSKQSSVICDYVFALKSEIKLSSGYRGLYTGRCHSIYESI